MLLRLSPTPARCFGDAAHRAPDPKRHQHRGYGAAGHACFSASRPGINTTGGFPGCRYRCSSVQISRRESRFSARRSKSSQDRSAPVQRAGRSVREVRAGGVIYLGAWLTLSRRRDRLPTQRVVTRRPQRLLPNKDDYAQTILTNSVLFPPKRNKTDRVF